MLRKRLDSVLSLINSVTKESYMPNDSKWNLAAPCGLYCGECLGLERGTCEGCRSGKGECLKYRAICKIYECCVNDKRHDFCYQCLEFPCKKFKDFFETVEWYDEVTNNLKRMKEIGLKKWLKEQEKRVKILKNCAESKGFIHCSQCKEWPCDKLKREPLTSA